MPSNEGSLEDKAPVVIGTIANRKVPASTIFVAKPTPRIKKKRKALEEPGEEKGGHYLE